MSRRAGRVFQGFQIVGKLRAKARRSNGHFGDLTGGIIAAVCSISDRWTWKLGFSWLTFPGQDEQLDHIFNDTQEDGKFGDQHVHLTSFKNNGR